MICFPNAKINLGLHIVSRRQDGYHNLETVFFILCLKGCIRDYTTPVGVSTKLSRKFRFSRLASLSLVTKRTTL